MKKIREEGAENENLYFQIEVFWCHVLAATSDGY